MPVGNASREKAGQYTAIIKGPDAKKNQPKNVYNLILKPGGPETATRNSVKPIEKYVVDNANPATIAAVNAQSKLIQIAVAPNAVGNPNENVLALKPMAALVKDGKSAQPVANGYPTPTKLTLLAIPLLAAAFWRILLGVLADKFGSKRVDVASMFVTLLPLIVAYQLANSYNALVFVAFFLGLAGASFAVSLPLASRWYPPHLQGIAMGIAGAGNSGTVLATLFAPMLARALGWHTVFGLMMIPVALTLIVFAVLAKDPPGFKKPASASDYFGALAKPDTLWFCILYFVTFGGFVGLSSFFNTFFERAQAVYFRAGNSSDELICLTLMRDGVPMRLFPLGAKADSHVAPAVVEDMRAGTTLTTAVAAPAGVSGMVVVDIGRVEI